MVVGRRLWLLVGVLAAVVGRVHGFYTLEAVRKPSEVAGPNDDANETDSHARFPYRDAQVRALAKRLQRRGELMATKCKDALAAGSLDGVPDIVLRELPDRYPLNVLNKENIFVHRNLDVVPHSLQTILHLFPANPDEVIGRYRWDECAIVGNSGSLLFTEYGKAIDSHDVVLRMNLAPTSKSYRKHVGRKTTFRMLNSKWARELSRGREDLTPFQEHEHGVGLIIRHNGYRPDTRVHLGFHEFVLPVHKDMRLYSIAPTPIEAAHHMLNTLHTCYSALGMNVEGGDKPSSGFIITMTFARLCKRLRLYGFGRPKYQGAQVPYRYYINQFRNGTQLPESVNNMANPAHSFELEQVALQSLQKASHGSVVMCGLGEALSDDCMMKTRLAMDVPKDHPLVLFVQSIPFLACLMENSLLTAFALFLFLLTWSSLTILVAYRFLGPPRALRKKLAGVSGALRNRGL
mmetsp:Transcript_30494/g.99086  ORF Transcript_30494/g.99086 Transcript_30494/m.99086 type:complete len:462 (+) Transcript_30494:145-1530(+)